MNFKDLSINTHFLVSFISALLLMALLLVSYFVLEPAVSRAAVDSDSFTVSQSVTGEIAITAPSNVTMDTAIGGVTGGSSDGQTKIVVTSNNPTGYFMTLEFATATAMQGESLGGEIQNYTPTSGIIPDYNFSVGANSAEFAYSVAASSTADIDTTFRNNGSVCNNDSGGDQLNKCWAAPSTTAGVLASETIITTTAATPDSGSTSTVKFKVQITANPSPSVPPDTYTATATLTATTN